MPNPYAAEIGKPNASLRARSTVAFRFNGGRLAMVGNPTRTYAGIKRFVKDFQAATGGADCCIPATVQC